jgi:HK97 family phage prohead protease
MITHYSGMIQKFTSELAAQRQVRFIASDATPDRQGDVLLPEGCDLTNFKRNPVLLWMHRADMPVAKAIEISASSRGVVALAQFPDEGVDEQADKVYRLIRSGVVNSVSVGFMPIKSTPLPKGGSKFTRWELLEVSFVSIPANPSAIITQRAMPDDLDALRERALALVASVRADDAALSPRERARQLVAAVRADDIEPPDPEAVRASALRLLSERDEW